jgi:copper transport protein
MGSNMTNWRATRRQPAATFARGIAMPSLLAALAMAFFAVTPVSAQETGLTGDPWWFVVSTNRVAQFASLLLAVGFGLFGLLVPAPAPVLASLRRKGITASVITAATYALAVVLGGAEMIGGPPSVIFDGAWAMGMRTTLGSSFWIGVSGLAVLSLGFLAGFKGIGRRLIFFGAIGSVAGLTATGHAATADPVWFMAPVVGIHLLCVAFWFGSFQPLMQTLRISDAVEGARVLNEFSFWAVFGVAMIAVSGTGIALVQIEWLSALWETDYGIRLLIKLGLVGALLGLAGINKVRLTPRLEAGDSAAIASLRRNVALEFLLVIGVLIATASMSLTTPPRSLAEMNDMAAATSFINLAGN